MENFVSQLGILAVVIVPIVNAIVQIIKATLPNIESKFYPVISIVAGIGVGLLLALSGNGELGSMAIAGGLAGMASCGAYDLVAGIKSKPVE